ncbi:sensor histidine kinase [Glaciihabitans sp. UYNi722]|uniref:sensor histidine kinase n=1 Tax=Glaciihabitans sp. UYNi722 TaxID=3156344 RepID=UPI003395BA1B
MPYRGRFTSARWHDRWQEPWDERIAAQGPPWRMGRWATLWLPVVFSLVTQIPSVFFRFRPGSGLTHSAQWDDKGRLLLSLIIAFIGPLALIAARRFPGPVVAITATAGGADLLLFSNSDHPPYVALAFAIVSAVVRGARVWAWISVAAVWVATLTIAIILGTDLAPPRIASITFGVLIVMGIGEAIRTRRDRYEEISRRVAERKLNEVQAERVRIARELHDVLAHSLSQINVQAGVGLHLMERQPDKAKEALASIKESSKTALDEVRSVLGILRAEGGADPSAPLVPEPDLSRLEGLVASMSGQGVEVELENQITSNPPAAAQLALYRIAQESLTNVIRHANATKANVFLREEARVYILTVTDDGVGAASQSKKDSGGRGLLGMHERAELLGGSLQASPLPYRGFRVTARIPRHTEETTE